MKDNNNYKPTHETIFLFKELPDKKYTNWTVEFEGKSYRVNAAQKQILEHLVNMGTPQLSKEIAHDVFPDKAYNPCHVAMRVLIDYGLVVVFRKTNSATPLYYTLNQDQYIRSAEEDYDLVRRDEYSSSKSSEESKEPDLPTWHDPSPEISDVPYISPLSGKTVISKALQAFVEGARDGFERTTKIENGVAIADAGRWVYVGTQIGKEITSAKPDEDDFTTRHPKTPQMLLA